MFVVCVNVSVKPESVEAFIDATLDNARNTRQEPGNLRFDVIQALDDAGKFMLYEVYHTPQDFERHQQTEHYARWKAKVTDWMAQPRQAVKYRPHFFGDAEENQ